MRSHWKQTWLVSSWEFRRYFKWKDQFIGFLVFIGLSLLAWGAGRLVSGGRRALTVATVNLPLTAPPESRLRFVPVSPDTAEHAALLREGEVSGILSGRVDGSFELRVEKDPRFLPELRSILADVVRRERLQASGMAESQLTTILMPPDLAVRFNDPERQRASPAERIAAGVFIALTMMGVFSGMAYLLTGITGEKQLRVTESITAIIPPQAWIDGKILGIGAYALATVFNMLLGGILLGIVARITWNLPMPSFIVRPGVIIVLVMFSVLALMLWNAAFAAFASTIDDPNTSTRTSIMFLPFIPVAMTISVLRDPDHVASRVLALFPLTSPSAMPVRVILSNPGLIEIVASAILLMGTVWLFRRLAGRIFEVGMLMYGKEPSLREMWRWATSGSQR